MIIPTPLANVSGFADVPCLCVQGATRICSEIDEGVENVSLTNTVLGQHCSLKARMCCRTDTSLATL